MMLRYNVCGLLQDVFNRLKWLLIVQIFSGIADQVRDAIATETEKSKEEAAKQIWSLIALARLTITVR